MFAVHVLAEFDAGASAFVLIDSPAGVLAVLLAVLALTFSAANRPVLGRIFKVVPALIFCYFVPTLLSTPWPWSGNAAGLRIIPNASPVYDFVKGFVLPAALFLLTLNVDLPGIVRLGPRAVGMMIAGSLGVVLGGPIAVWLWQSYLPDGGHLPLSYLAGSWIGGAPNAIAVQKSFTVSDAAIGPVIVVDAFISNIWLAVLLFFAARSKRIDARLRTRTDDIDRLVARMEHYHAETRREAGIGDILALVALGFGAAWLGELFGEWCASIDVLARRLSFIGPFAWKVMFVTFAGVACSFTALRRLEGVGASRFGGAMIYLLVACIGAGADFAKLGDAKGYLLIAATWMLVHVVVLVAAAVAMRAPLFFAAVGSQANIGGPASAPIVAGAFHPTLAPVGALLAIAGYVLGTLGGLLCVHLMNWALHSAP